MELHFAPIQGHTDAAFRHFHSELFGSDMTYYSPFIRLEKGSIRPRDLKDITSELNANYKIIPQIIFRDENELTSLTRILKEQGFKEINLNMGCPFPLQTGHGRGAAVIKNEDLLAKIVETVSSNPDESFSVKMRLGLDNNEEWKTALPYLNKINLSHVTLHPRVARQQYKGEVDLKSFEEFLEQSKNPVIYNGDIRTTEDIHEIERRFPKIAGVMLGRGILSRPTLANEYLGGKVLPHEELIDKILEFHQKLFSHYEDVLCGDKQLISKIKPFWEYSEDIIGRKAWKAINKATSISKYQTAIAMIE